MTFLGIQYDTEKMTLSLDEQKLSDKWMGGNVQTFMLGVADVFQEAGSIPQALDSYVASVDSSYLAATGTE